jgi:nucleotide-binding universal stress UspA family protein
MADAAPQASPTTRDVVLVGVDGSDMSIEALRWAGGYAGATGAVVRAVRTWHYPWAMQSAPRQIDSEVTAQNQQELDDAVKKAALDPGVALETQILEGHAAKVLVEESRRAQLLVVGSRGHGAFAEMLLGSVSQHCAQRAACPVVIVRAK